MTSRSEQGYNIGVVGATGLVGREFLKILETRHSPDLPIGSVKLFASRRSAGKKVVFQGVDHVIEEGIPHPKQFEGLDFVITAVGDKEARLYSPAIAQAGALNVDKSNAWRMDPEVPLVVPEVNPQDAKEHHGIIAGPNCSTTQMVVVLNSLHVVNPIESIVVDTYQAVSGTGEKGISELEGQVKAYARGEQLLHDIYPQQILFNAIPEIGGLIEGGNYSEEAKVVGETRKILHAPEMPIDATCVRVPVLNGHSEAIHIVLTDTMTREEAIDIFVNAPGIEVVDDPANSRYATALSVTGKDKVYISRVRGRSKNPRGLSMWVVGDNIRKGAALNAIQVFELVARNNWIKGKRED